MKNCYGFIRIKIINIFSLNEENALNDMVIINKNENNYNQKENNGLTLKENKIVLLLCFILGFIMCLLPGFFGYP